MSLSTLLTLLLIPLLCLMLNHSNQGVDQTSKALYAIPLFNKVYDNVEIEKN